MKSKTQLEFNRKALAAAFGIVGAVIPSRTTKPILQNIKLNVTGGKTAIIGTDSEISIQYELPGEYPDVQALLPARRTAEILREMTSDNVTLRIEKDAVLVCNDLSEFRLPTADPAEYPAVPTFKSNDVFAVRGQAFRQMIQRTIFATDSSTSRYALGGVLFDLQGNTLSMAATDSRRLALVKAVGEVRGSCKLNGPIVPAKALSLLERVIPNDDDIVEMAPHGQGIIFSAANFTIHSLLVEGRFPRYQDVIPKSHELSVELIAGQFHSTVRQAQIVTNAESRGVDFQFGDGTLLLTSQAADIGTSRIEMPISYSGNELTIRFDPLFISDFLKVLPPESQVSFKLSTDEDPGVLTTDDDYTYVIMPLSRDGG